MRGEPSLAFIGADTVGLNILPRRFGRTCTTAVHHDCSLQCARCMHLTVQCSRELLQENLSKLFCALRSMHARSQAPTLSYIELHIHRSKRWLRIPQLPARARHHSWWPQRRLWQTHQHVPHCTTPRTTINRTERPSPPLRALLFRASTHQLGGYGSRNAWIQTLL